MKREILTTDSYFVQGSTHRKCEDFALHDENVVIVCDGCSSSPDTDIGSRLLAKAALSNLKACEAIIKRPISNSSLPCVRDQQFKTAIKEAFKESIFKAQAAVKVLSMPDDCLDATMLALVSNGDDISLFATGDGGYIYKKNDGSITAALIDYEDGAPEYLSYTLNKDRHIGYLETFNRNKEIRHFSAQDLKNFSRHIHTDLLFERHFQKNDIEWITIFSDGIATFEGLNWQEVALELGNFKRLGGEVIKRRMKRFLKDISKKGITHADDFSAATIVLKDVEDA